MILKRLKPILFNTDMVEAILKDKKNVTRRVVKLDLGLADMDKNDGSYLKLPDEYGDFHNAKDLCKYQPGDILYVRETWQITSMNNIDKRIKFLFRAKPNEILNDTYVGKETYDNLIKFSVKNGWQPSLFMPKEAARIFLKVTNVDIQRIQNITDDEIKAEGVREFTKDGDIFKYNHKDEFDWQNAPRTPREAFRELWDSTVKKKDLPIYGWEANPWVWIIEFKRINHKLFNLDELEQLEIDIETLKQMRDYNLEESIKVKMKEYLKTK